jgi:hypothetical protein
METDTAAAILALVLAGDVTGARLLGADDSAMAVASAARRVIGDLGVDTQAFTLADAVGFARWEASLGA